MKINPHDYVGLFYNSVACEGVNIPQYGRDLRTEMVHDTGYLKGQFILNQAEDPLLELRGGIALSMSDVSMGMTKDKLDFVFTERALEAIRSAQAINDFAIEGLSPLKENIWCLNLYPQLAFNVWVVNEDIKFICFRGVVNGKTGESELDWYSASLDNIDKFSDIWWGARVPDEQAAVLDRVQYEKGLLLKALVFLLLTNPEIAIIPPSQASGKPPIAYTTGNANSIWIVDSQWNKYIVRLEGFGVSGHFRTQPCGVGKTDLKRVWVNPHNKHGYIRKPKSAALL